MQAWLKDVLCCLQCGASRFELRSTVDKGTEIRSGELACGECARKFRITDGIPDFIDPADEWIAGEREHARRIQDELPQRLGSEPAAREFTRRQTLGYDEPSFYDLLTRSTMDQALQMAEVRPEMRVLGIGDSSGRDLCRLFGVRGCQGVVVDVSEYLTLSDIVIETTGVYYDRVHASMARLPFVPGSFDVAFASACVHHVEDPRLVFRALKRLLRPGGLFILVNERTISRLRPAHKDSVKVSDEDAHESVYFFHEWTRMLKEEGFSVRPFRSRFLTYRARLERRLSYGSKETSFGRALRAYFGAMSKLEAVPAIGDAPAALNFLWERELIGDLGYSCIARRTQKD